jgi:hypothetical protein
MCIYGNLFYLSLVIFPIFPNVEHKVFEIIPEEQTAHSNTYSFCDRFDVDT